MKKAFCSEFRAALCAVLCTLIALTALCACGNSETVVSGGDATAETKWIDQYFAGAERMYAWFAGCARPSCDMNDTADVEGTVYVRVTEPGLTDLAALRSRLTGIFADEIVDGLMETVVYSGAPVFRDIDSRLYCCSEFHGQVPYDLGERIGTVDSETESEMVYRVDVTYDYYSSSFAASRDYHLIKDENGDWRFQNFELPALLIAEQMFTDDQQE